MNPEDRATLEAFKASAQTAGEEFAKIRAALAVVACVLADVRNDTQDDYTLAGPGK